MPDNERTTPLIKMKVGTITDLAENTNYPALEPGSVLFAIDAETGKGKILFDLPTELRNSEHPENYRIIMSTDAEFADYATTAGTAQQANVATAAGVLSNFPPIDGVGFDGSKSIIHYGVCNTGAAVAAKTVTCQDFGLLTGSRIMVKYTYTNTAENPTLSVNNSPAKPIYYKGAAMPTPYIQANSVHEYVYDGTNWNYVGTLASELGITIDENINTLFITSPIENGDGVSY